jgi:hypothetical protein
MGREFLTYCRRNNAVHLWLIVNHTWMTSVASWLIEEFMALPVSDLRCRKVVGAVMSKVRDRYRVLKPEKGQKKNPEYEVSLSKFDNKELRFGSFCGVTGVRHMGALDGWASSWEKWNLLLSVGDYVAGYADQPKEVFLCEDKQEEFIEFVMRLEFVSDNYIGQHLYRTLAILCDMEPGIGKSWLGQNKMPALDGIGAMTPEDVALCVKEANGAVFSSLWAMVVDFCETKSVMKKRITLETLSRFQLRDVVKWRSEELAKVEGALTGCAYHSAVSVAEGVVKVEEEAALLAVMSAVVNPSSGIVRYTNTPKKNDSLSAKLRAMGWAGHEGL